MKDHRTINVLWEDAVGDEPAVYKDVEISVPARPWTIEPHTGIDKSFRILCANGYEVMTIDYDDVNHAEQDLLAEWIVDLANRTDADGEQQLQLEI